MHQRGFPANGSASTLAPPEDERQLNCHARDPGHQHAHGERDPPEVGGREGPKERAEPEYPRGSHDDQRDHGSDGAPTYRHSILHQRSPAWPSNWRRALARSTSTLLWWPAPARVVSST